MENRLSHISEDGSATMVDVSHKPETLRSASASGHIYLQPGTLELIEVQRIAKGNVLATARIAGIQAAKHASSMIPLCHSLLLFHVGVDFEMLADGIRIVCEVRTIGRTGAEMEALMGVSVAGLTIYDMCKAVDKTMRIGEIQLDAKSKVAHAA